MKVVIIIMGVSGSGKTTIGKAISTKLSLPFFDADDFHPEANIKKMSSGKSLYDEDRLPWLTNLAQHIRNVANKNGAVLACSALKQSYRNILSKYYNDIQWVFLNGSFELINARMQKRENHFMPVALLQSQFNTLEMPKNAIVIDINDEIDNICSTIVKKLKMNQNSDFGIIGLGVMGKNIALNAADNGISVSVYNRSDFGEAHMVSDFIQANSSYQNLNGFTDLKEFVESLERPRKIFLMIKAGDAIDAVTEQILPFLEDDDIIIDGGNSHFKDTIRRIKALEKNSIHFVGCGVSGGEEGARKGPSIMPGGSSKAYKHIGHILEKISAKDADGNPCCCHVGTDGAGHYIKMIHNGIEYAEMQILAEVYDLLRRTHKNEEIAYILEDWSTRSEDSYLLEITIAILRKQDEEGFILDRILDKAMSKGTGSWSIQSTLELGIPSSLMSSAVFSRYLSALKATRISLSKNIKQESNNTFTDYSQLENAYRFARLINHQQGFNLINRASKHYQWNLNLSEIARIWTNGCIIRSKLMVQSISIFRNFDDYFDDSNVISILKNAEESAVFVLKYALNHRLNLNAFSEAYNYWIGMTTKNSSANLIQAQRDYFGAHTYQRNDIDSNDFFHTNW